MAKKPYFPDTLADQMLWFIGFKAAVPTYATKYGISLAELDSLNADHAWLGHWFAAQELNVAFGQNLTGFKNEVAYGLPAGSTIPSEPPVLPVFGTAPAVVLPGVFVRALALANRIKSHYAYTTTDGEAMKLEGAEQDGVDVPNLKPVITLVVPGPNHVEIFWKKNRTEGVEIWVKRGSGAWMLLAFDTTTPKYVDTHEFPAVEEIWEYKAIYHYGGVQAGLWSEVVSVQVKA